MTPSDYLIVLVGTIIAAVVLYLAEIIPNREYNRTKGKTK